MGKDRGRGGAWRDGWGIERCKLRVLLLMRSLKSHLSVSLDSEKEQGEVLTLKAELNNDPSSLLLPRINSFTLGSKFPSLYLTSGSTSHKACAFPVWNVPPHPPPVLAANSINSLAGILRNPAIRSAAESSGESSEYLVRRAA